MPDYKTINTNTNNGQRREYQQGITEVKTAMDGYNTLLSTLDEKLNFLKDKEKVLRNWNEGILNGVASKYGKDSSEYEQAGGVRKSERKKPTRKATVA